MGAVRTAVRALIAAWLLIGLWTILHLREVEREAERELARQEDAKQAEFNRENRVHHPDFKVVEIPNALTPEECDRVVQLALKRGLTDSHVLTEQGGGFNVTARSSAQVFLREDEDKIMEKIMGLAVKLSGLPREHHEQLQVVNYGRGGFYVPHFDACSFGKDSERCIDTNRGAGQRKTTLMIYLNDEFEGGETVFPTAGLRVKPVKGKAVFWDNVDEEERIYLESLHGGASVTAGDKWICNYWGHVRTLPVDTCGGVPPSYLLRDHREDQCDANTEKLVWYHHMWVTHVMNLIRLGEISDFSEWKHYSPSVPPPQEGDSDTDGSGKSQVGIEPAPPGAAVGPDPGSPWSAFAPTGWEVAGGRVVCLYMAWVPMLVLGLGLLLME